MAVSVTILYIIIALLVVLELSDEIKSMQINAIIQQFTSKIVNDASLIAFSQKAFARPYDYKKNTSQFTLI